MDFTFDEILIDERVTQQPLVRKVLENLPDVPVFTGSDTEIKCRIAGSILALGKRKIHITGDRGELVKPCPATNPPYLCCQYTVINSANQCPMDCTYCVLQNYLEKPLITLYANQADIFSQVKGLQERQPDRFFRFGTGELADSLALDYITEQSRDFIRFFNQQRNCLLELKTKTASVENILRENPNNTVAAWSVNPQKIITSQELRAAPLSERLTAARKCQNHGCLLAFHFDPIVQTENAVAMYQETVDQIFSVTDPDRVAWISLGALRYPPDLKKIIQRRFPGSGIVYEEMIRGLDGKMRYLRPQRVKLFQTVYERIRTYSENLFIYFCMEPPWVWDEVMGFHPESNADLDFRFAESIHQRFPGIDMDEPVREAYVEK